MGHPAIWPSGDSAIGSVIFGVLLVAAWVAFLLRIRKLVNLLRLGQPENRFDHLGDRVKFFMLMVLGQRGVLRDPLPGIAHFFTFWGFIIIQLDALNLWAMGFHFEIPIIGSPIFAALLDFFCLRRVPRPHRLRLPAAGATPKAVTEPVA